MTLTSADISDVTEREVIYDPGSGHRMIVTTFNFNTKKSLRNSVWHRWNFTKTNWNVFTLDLESIFGSSSSFCEAGESTDYAFSRFTKITFGTAKKLIPRSKQFEFKPFWNENLLWLGLLRNISKGPRIFNIGESMLLSFVKKFFLLIEIGFNNFISKIDYRKDGKNVYNYVNKLLNNKITSTRELLKFVAVV